METLRTPDDRFPDLPGYPFAPRYAEVPDPDGGTLRMHYVDEGPADAEPVLCACTGNRPGPASTGR